MTMMMHALLPLLMLLTLAFAVPSPQLLDQEALDPDQVISLNRYYLRSYPYIVICIST